MIKKFVSTALFSLVALFSMQSQAFIVTQSLDLEVTYADAGNAFGLDVGNYFDVGFVSYDTADPTVVGFGFADPTTSGFDLSFNLGAIFFSDDMDTDYPNFPQATLVDVLDPLSGVGELDAALGDTAGNTVDIFQSFFSAFDTNFLEVSGLLVVDPDANIPNPATLALLALGMFLLRNRRMGA